jgi:hypothetical protein
MQHSASRKDACAVFAGWRERCVVYPGRIRRLWNGRAATIKIKSDRGGKP